MENPKLNLASSCEDRGSEEKMSAQKITVSDHINGFQYTSDKSDGFVIDMESFSNREINPNSRITRSLSRKGSQRGDKKIITSNSATTNSSSTVDDIDCFVAAPSPKGSSTPEKPTVVSVGSTDHGSNQQVHHQITITTGNFSAAAAESRFSLRRNSFRRSSPSWLFDPKRILFFFATLSSMGTILLIYFTLSIGRMYGDENALD